MAHAHQPSPQQPQQQQEDDRVEALVDAQLRDVADVVLASRMDGCFNSVMKSAASQGRHALLGALLTRLHATQSSSCSNANNSLHPDRCKAISAAWLAAAYHGHPQCLQVLLDTCTSSSPASVAELLDVRDYKKDMSRGVDHRNHTALMIAVWHGHAPCVQLLLGHHPESQVDAVTDYERTALMLAVSRGQAECVQLLLDHIPETQVAATADNGWNPLMSAAHLGHTDCLQLLLAHNPIDQVAEMSFTGSTALKRAAAHGHAKCLEFLLQYNPPKSQLDQALLELCKCFRELTAHDHDKTGRVCGMKVCAELLLASGAVLPAQAIDVDSKVLQPINQLLTAKLHSHKRSAKEEGTSVKPSKCTRMHVV